MTLVLAGVNILLSDTMCEDDVGTIEQTKHPREATGNYVPDAYSLIKQSINMTKSLNQVVKGAWEHWLQLFNL